MALAWTGCSQNSRFLPQARRTVGSGDKNGFEWICKHNRLRPEPMRFVRLDSEHAQSDGKSVNRGLPLLDLARDRDSWCWPKGARRLGTRMFLDRSPSLEACNYTQYSCHGVFTDQSIYFILVVFIFRVFSLYFGFAGDWENWGENVRVPEGYWISTLVAKIHLHCRLNAVLQELLNRLKVRR